MPFDQHTTLEPIMSISMPTLSGFGLACLLAVSPALALEPDAPATSLTEAVMQGKSISSFRLRYEYVDQTGKEETADAWTLRSLIGWQTRPFHDFSVTAQLIGVSPFNHQYNDLDKGVPNPRRLDYPVVADPEDYDVNQLFLQWSGLPSTKIRLGRQAVFLDNWRFVGDVRFRQVMQVMDGIALENRSLPDTEIYVAHFERIKQVTTKRQDVNVELMNIKYRFTPSESLTGYGYLVDWDGSDLEANSSKTFGLRLDGARKVSDHWKLLYTAEYAKQDDYRDGHRDIDNHYYRIGAGLGRGEWFLRLDQEKLSGNIDGRAFQTPLGTNHLFQGWADVFLTTPTEGIEDTMLIAGGKIRGVTLKAEYHWIDGDRKFAEMGGGRGERYGEELDLSAGYSFGKQWNGLVEYANFREKDEYADARKRNIEKLWLTLMYSF
jgi:hypothetical protein